MSKCNCTCEYGHYDSCPRGQYDALHYKVTIDPSISARKNSALFHGKWIDALIWYNLTGQVLEGYKLGDLNADRTKPTKVL